jgi:hypothetical protein
VTRLKSKLVSVRLEIVLILTQDRCTVCAERTGWNSNLISVHLETMLVQVQDRCTSSANVPQAKKLFWMHSIELLDDKAQV